MEISTYAVSTLKKDASSEQVTVSRKVTVASKSDYNKVKVLENENYYDLVQNNITMESLFE